MSSLFSDCPQRSEGGRFCSYLSQDVQGTHPEATLVARAAAVRIPKRKETSREQEPWVQRALTWRVVHHQCWERLKAGGEGDDRGWDDWMASPTQWTWIWVSSRSWWWTGRPGMLWSMGSRRVKHNWATELNLQFLNMVVLIGFNSF